ncbi:MAG: MbcA/ParS/Xre antitoxin family protein [Gammaproteobacteria bacterium]|nr:MbcA/ParS/Xre antitoxin family protein [Gammaproteobacteria bacterium]
MIAVKMPNIDESEVNRAALQAFFGITEDWKLTAEQQRVLLGQPPESTFFKLKKNRDGRLSIDQLDRISYLMGIHKALRIILGDIKEVERWIHAANDGEPFSGSSALDRMLAGKMEDLAAVRRYLDVERGG